CFLFLTLHLPLLSLFPYTTLFRSITLPDSAPVYPGHDFTGWYLNPEFTGAIYQPSGSFKIPAKNVTFYASYGIQKYQLIFDTKGDRKSTRLNSSHVSISYAVFCLK